MRRRDFLILTAMLACPVAAVAEEPRRVIGYMSSAALIEEPTGWKAAFLQGLKDTGFIEGANINIEHRSAEGQYDRLTSLAAELVDRDVAVIVCTGLPAAKAASRTIPIVFVTGADPIKLGLIDNFSRPGGNLTGVSILASSVGPKRLEILRELVPTASMMVLLGNSTNPQDLADAPEIRAAADALGLHLQVLMASTESDLETAFSTMGDQRADALIVMPDAFLGARRHRVVALAARHGVPAIYPWREFVEAGGLISYGSPVAKLYHLLGTQTGKILRGAKPADLPVQQTANLELVINLKTAKVLGLTVPQSLLARADEIIQ